MNSCLKFFPVMAAGTVANTAAGTASASIGALILNNRSFLFEHRYLSLYAKGDAPMGFIVTLFLILKQHNSQSPLMNLVNPQSIDKRAFLISLLFCLSQEFSILIGQLIEDDLRAQRMDEFGDLFLIKSVGIFVFLVACLTALKCTKRCANQPDESSRSPDEEEVDHEYASASA